MKTLRKIFFNPISSAVLFATCAWINRHNYWLFWGTFIFGVLDAYDSLKIHDRGYTSLKE